ncbi:hypothetical protein [Salinisphaera sp. G21_0]|uniref:hypothetical protein n=1 Tax=Salinisphaera sp. G21_0 TaxID=2821094 RepID=UPI001ADA2EAF|nr:hypothetical protein [Salinisphaera sp. G21_0]MBO9481304.1 hypothetical protein [Salinisphaera sp. G21_0]
MITATPHANSQQAIRLSELEGGSALAASVDVKFGDTFRTIQPVVEPGILQRANDAINIDSYDFVKDKYQSILRSRLCSQVWQGVDDSQCIFSLIPEGYPETKVRVQFAPDARIVNQESFARQLMTSDKALIELAIKGVEVLAGQFSLQGQTVEFVALGIIRNFIRSGGLGGSFWSRDRGDYSLVMLMNDDSVKEGGPYYTGGGLATAELESRDCFGIYYATEGSVEDHPFEQNLGHVYSNTGSLIHRFAKAKYVPDETEKQPAKPRENYVVMPPWGKPVEQRLLHIIMTPLL